MDLQIPEGLSYSDVRYLPIVKHFAKKINLVDTLDTMVSSQMDLSPGIAVLAMVLDTLSGRTPLYRLEEFFFEKDIELLIGSDIEPSRFSDYNLARVLDKIYETGTQKVFSAIAQNAVTVFNIDTRRAHFDTTSVSVYGDYDYSDPSLDITYGHSKDKRPDLKQFLISLLCVDRNIPIIGTCEDGNASDKTLNNDLLGNISKHMARHGLGPGAFVYVADSAFVTPDNLKRANEKKIQFLTRLPATYKECSRAIAQAVGADDWIEIGTLNQTPETTKRKAAHYRGYETTVELYQRPYRAVVIHSSAHDKRRHKRIDRILTKKRKELESVCKQVNAKEYYCQADAERAVEKLSAAASGSFHQLQCEIKKVAKYPRGRPAKDKPRTPTGYEYQLAIKITQDDTAVAPMRLEAGCFVLLCNIDEQWTAKELLQLYKDQSGIEHNFGFLKDPLIVNSIFLKRPHRIEVLGLVMVISLLIWRLIERSMRQYIEHSGKTITGWKKRPTKRPTSFMLTTKFLEIPVLRLGSKRQLARPLRPVQLEFLEALGLTPDIFTVP
jgi:transposase